MAIYEFTQQTMPTPEQFGLLLKENDDSYNPLEALLSLNRDLCRLEQQYQLDSAEFYRRYQAGSMGDSLEFIGWAGRYRLYMDLKAAISISLNMVLTETALATTEQISANYAP